MTGILQRLDAAVDWMTANQQLEGLERVRARFLVGVLFLMMVPTVAGLIRGVLVQSSAALMSDGAMVLLVFSTGVLLRAGQFNAARHVYCFGMIVLSNMLVILTGGANSGTIPPMLIVVTMNAMLLPFRSGILSLALLIGTGISQFTHPIDPGSLRMNVPPPGVFTLGSLALSAFVAFLILATHQGLEREARQAEELKRAVADLEATTVSREQLSAVLSSLKEFILVTDADRRIVSLNQAVQHQGWSEHDLLGKKLDVVLVGMDFEDPGSWRSACFQDPHGVKIPVVVSRGAYVSNDDQEVWAATDVSAERSAMEALSHANQRAHAASSAKSSFLANMSHELRTPLNAIIGYTELLADEIEDPSHTMDLARVKNAATSLLGLINGVLDLSKIEAGKEDLDLARVTIGALLVGPLALVEPRAEAADLDLVVVGDFDPDLVLHTDRIKLEQVLTNLLTNAVKFTPSGRISIHVVPWKREGLPWLRVSVEDTGIGLTAEQLERVFDPFSQAENDLNQTGTGLGLSICKAYVEMLGGQLYAESAPGKGSSFTVELPVATLAHITPGSAATETPLPEARVENSRQVLVIDDDLRFLTLMERVLAEPGRQIITTTDPRQALVWATTYRADLIVLDVAMPSISGWSFLVRLRETASADSPVLVVSGAGEKDVAAALGAKAFLQKPVSNQAVSNVVDRLLG